VGGTGRFALIKPAACASGITASAPPVVEPGERVGGTGRYELIKQTASVRARRRTDLLREAAHAEGLLLLAPEFVEVPVDVVCARDLEAHNTIQALENKIFREEALREDGAESYAAYTALGAAYESIGAYAKASFCFQHALGIAELEFPALVREATLRLAQLYHDVACITQDHGVVSQSRLYLDKYRAKERVRGRTRSRAHMVAPNAAQSRSVSLPSSLKANDEGSRMSYQRLSDAIGTPQLAAGSHWTSEASDRSLSTGAVGSKAREASRQDGGSLIRALIQIPLESYERKKAMQRGEMEGARKEEKALGERQAVEGVGSQHHGYRMRETVGVGGYGEVWSAKKAEGGGEEYVLKRLFVERGNAVRLSGLREIHFGVRLAGVPHTCRFVEAFEEKGEQGTDLWLVFCSEGLSLSHYLYEASTEGDFVNFCSSSFWKRYRTSPQGSKMIRELMRQLLEGIANCHKSKITHRDLKPSNLIVHIPSHEEQCALGEEEGVSLPVLKLADFGSAVDEYTCSNLYGLKGPSVDDETLDYAPPEVLFGDGVASSAGRPHSYDLWSAGVIFLELVLGTSKVFQVDARTRAVISHRVQSSSSAGTEQACLLRALIELRIYPPEDSSLACNDSPSLDPALERASACLKRGSNRGQDVEKEAAEDAVERIVRERDELGMGMPSRWAVKLLRRLLKWNPEDRISAERALMHAYFKGDDEETGFLCSDGEEHEFEDE